MGCAGLVSCGGGETDGAKDAAAPGAKARLKVVTTVPVLHEMVTRIGGDHVDVVCLRQPTDLPGAFDLHAGDVQAIAAADVVFAIDAGYEGAMLGAIAARANGKVIRLAEHSEVAAMRGTSEPTGTAWVDPRCFGLFMRQVADALSLNDPSHRADYEWKAGRNGWGREQEQLLWFIEGGEKPARAPMITNDAIAAEFGRLLGMTVVRIDLDAERQPTASDQATLSSAAKAVKAGVIAVDSKSNSALAEMLAVVAEETGARMLRIPITDPNGWATSDWNYVPWMKENVAELMRASSRR